MKEVIVYRLFNSKTGEYECGKRGQSVWTSKAGPGGVKARINSCKTYWESMVRLGHGNIEYFQSMVDAHSTDGMEIHEFKLVRTDDNN